MNEIVEKLIEEVGLSFQRSSFISDELLSALHFVLQNSLQSALDLIDQRKVTILRSPSGKSLYQVIGSSGLPYLCLVDADYCECPSYKYSILKKEDLVLCKHLLAAKIGQRMGICHESNVTEEQMVNLIRGLD